MLFLGSRPQRVLGEYLGQPNRIFGATLTVTFTEFKSIKFLFCLTFLNVCSWRYQGLLVRIKIDSSDVLELCLALWRFVNPRLPSSSS